MQFLALLVLVVLACASPYPVDDTKGPARALDGIGGLSGGGATSVFLPSYPQKQRDEILDYLFKPNFGASLHILKVEIGGDAQSTDGAESSHMHNPWEENYERGYEWWLMAEAKKRNPDILLYGLAWAYPQWVTCAPGTMENCTNDIYIYPDVTARYVTKWISGAKNTYGLDIDYLPGHYYWNSGKGEKNMYDIPIIIGMGREKKVQKTRDKNTKHAQKNTLRVKILKESRKQIQNFRKNIKKIFKLSKLFGKKNST